MKRSTTSAFAAAACVTLIALLLLSGAAAARAPAGLSGTSRTLLPGFAGISIVKNVSVGKDPTGVTYDPANHELYVANTGAHTVSVISDTKNKVVATIAVGTEPTQVLYDPTSQQVYVVNAGSENVSIIGTKNTVVASVPFHGYSEAGAVYDPANGDVYLASEGFVPPSTVEYNLSRIAHGNHTLTAIRIGTGPNYPTYDNATTEMAVSNGGANSVSFVNSTTNSVTTVTLKTGKTPLFMTYDPKTRDLAVADVGTGTAAAHGNLTIFSPAHAVVTTVKVGPFPNTVAIDPLNGAMVVTSTGLVNPKTGKFPNGTVTVVSSTNKVSATLTVGRSAYAAAWSPRTQDFYIACEGSNLTFVLNGSTFVLIGKPLATPQYAGDAVYDPGRGEIAVIGFSNLTGTPAKTIVTLISAANTVAGSLTLPTGPVGGGAYDPNNQDAYLSNGGAGSVSVIH